MSLQVEPVAYARTPYPEKFAIPRQPGLVNADHAIIEFQPNIDATALRGIQDFSHLWVIFQFHQTTAQGWKPMVRPPRLGGNKKLGVFATRSTFRPNNLGLSVVELVAVEQTANGCQLVVAGADWVDGTPIIDIKPYLPYVDAIPDAKGGFANEKPAQMTSRFSATAAAQIEVLQGKYPQLKTLITQVLAQDPRPAYQAQTNPEKVYGMALYDLNIQWQVQNGENLVLSVG